MNKSVILAFVLALVLSSCGECSKGKVKDNKDTPCGNYMTNEQIITETKVCEDAGLSASALHCGNDHTTTRIQCEPLPTNTVTGEE